MSQGESETGFAGWQVLPHDVEPSEWLREPYPWYEERREQGPGIHYDEHEEVYHIFRYDDVKTFINRADGEYFSAEETKAPEDSPLSPMNDIFDFQDPPEHTNKKTVLQEYFTSAYVNEHYWDSAEDIIEEQFDRALEDGNTFDFVTDVAAPIPIKIISDMIGFPKERWSDIMNLVNALGVPSPEEFEEGGLTEEERMEQILGVMNHIEELYDTRKDDPQDDLISKLIGKDKANGEVFTRSEVIENSFILIAAGGATTVNLLGNAVRIFDTEGYYQEIRAGDYNMETVIDEVLRYRSPINQLKFVSLQNQDIGGVTIPEGKTVIGWLGSANRDPRQFDDPDTFVPDRRPNRHLAFSDGPHFCLGAALARMEGKVALLEMFDRFEDLDTHLEESEPAHNPMEHGFLSLPVTVTPAK